MPGFVRQDPSELIIRRQSLGESVNSPAVIEDDPITRVQIVDHGQGMAALSDLFEGTC